jgi:hypothetical protein
MGHPRSRFVCPAFENREDRGSLKWLGRRQEVVRVPARKGGPHGYIPTQAEIGLEWATLYNLVGVVKRHVECLGSAVTLREC